MVILAVKAVEGAGIIKDGQILVAVLGSSGHSIFGIATTGTGGADKSSYTVGRKRVVIIRQISFVRTSAYQFTVSDPAKSAVTHATFRYPALVKTE